MVARSPTPEQPKPRYRLTCLPTRRPGVRLEYRVTKSTPGEKVVETTYTVSVLRDGRIDCSCPGHVFGLRRTGQPCKHARFVHDLLSSMGVL